MSKDALLAVNYVEDVKYLICIGHFSIIIFL